MGVDDESMKYEYLGRKITKAGKVAKIHLPDVFTEISLTSDGDLLEVEEGIAFSPCYKIAAYKKLSKGGMKSCLKLAREN